jgi:hypothetical protein
MKFWDELMGKLFGNAVGNVTHKENFTQKPGDEEMIAAWMEGEGSEVMELIYKNYHFQKASINAQPAIKLYNTPYANGFAVFFQPPLTKELFSNLFFAFGRRIVDLGYQKVSLDRKIQELGKEVKTVEKQYFKPPLRSEDFGRKIDQLFGNVSVEKVLFDNQPSYITVLVTVYSDHLYQDAKPFDQFVEQIFNHSHG